MTINQNTYLESIEIETFLSSWWYARLSIIFILHTLLAEYPIAYYCGASLQKIEYVLCATDKYVDDNIFLVF